jgi:hypothetical protein
MILLSSRDTRPSESQDESNAMLVQCLVQLLRKKRVSHSSHRADAADVDYWLFSWVKKDNIGESHSFLC